MCARVTGRYCTRETANSACKCTCIKGKSLLVNARGIIANIFPENICPFKSVPWLVKTYPDKKSAYVTDTSHARKAEKTAYFVPGREKNLPVNVRVIIANIFPENFCPFKSVPWLVKTYTDKKSAYVTDTSHAPVSYTHLTLPTTPYV